MPSREFAERAVRRREMRLGHPRHWWRRSTPLCVLFAFAIGAWSFAELQTPLLGSAWTMQQAETVGGTLLFFFLMLGPVNLATSLRRDLQSKVIDEILVAGVSPEAYLRGKLIGAVRPTFVIILALWLRWMLIQIRFNTALGQYVGLQEDALVMMHLVYGSVGFFLGSLVWILGILCYSALVMWLTLRWRGTLRALEITAVAALLVDVTGPWILMWGIRNAGAAIQDKLIGVLVAAAMITLTLKYLLYRWFSDHSAEHLQTWTQECTQ